MTRLTGETPHSAEFFVVNREDYSSCSGWLSSLLAYVVLFDAVQIKFGLFLRIYKSCLFKVLPFYLSFCQPKSNKYDFENRNSNTFSDELRFNFAYAKYVTI